MRWLFRIVPLFLWGLIAAGVGGFFFFVGSQPVPAEAALTNTQGVVVAASQLTKKKRRRSDKVSYKFTVQDGAGAKTEFSMPESEISESQVQSIMGQTVTVKHDGGSVYALSSAAGDIRTYAQSRKSMEEVNGFNRNLGMGLIPLGLVIFAGSLW
ncbi:MAG: hypothetical protein ACR2O4_12755, partial [Hyphomicrobiaceae bacterium]